MLSARWGVGSAARGTVALGVLVCGCVFAAVAGRAELAYADAGAAAGPGRAARYHQVRAGERDLVRRQREPEPDPGRAHRLDPGDRPAPGRDAAAAGRGRLGRAVHQDAVRRLGLRGHRDGRSRITAQAGGGLPRPVHRQRPDRGRYVRHRRGSRGVCPGGGDHADGGAVRPASGLPPRADRPVGPGRAGGHRGRGRARRGLDLLDPGHHRRHAVVRHPGRVLGRARCWRILVRWRPYRTHSGCRGWRWSGSSRCGWGV